jgi:hypothetical protein
MTALDLIAERRIREAQERGEFEGLPGAGAPLALDDDALVPEDLRVAHRILRNAGLLPPQLEPCREIREVEALLAQVEDEEGRTRLLSRINFLLSRTGYRGSLVVEASYFESVAERLGRGRAPR